MRAVIAATPNNRVDNSYVAFFSRLFGERLFENRRVIIMELRPDAPLDLQKMTNAASLTYVNNIVGSYLNQNPQLLYREWMADGVYKYLDANFAPIPDDPNVLQPLQVTFTSVINILVTDCLFLNYWYMHCHGYYHLCARFDLL